MFDDHTYIPRPIRRAIILISIIMIGIHLCNFLSSRKKHKTERLNSIVMTDSNENIVEDISNSKVHLIPFNPNTVDSLTLANIGLSEFAVNNLLKLRRTGWRAKKSEDLLQVYGLDESDLTRLNGYIVINKVPQLKRDRKDRIRTIGPVGNANYHEFDPNDVDYNTLIELEFNEYVSRSIVRFREKGGVFKKREDLLKMYGIDTSHYAQIEQYMRFPELEHEETDENLTDKEDQELSFFDPNMASVDELMSLGFTKFSAQNLTRFITSGGRINENDDLKRIYGIKEDFYDRISPFIVIDSTRLTTQMYKKDSSTFVDAAEGREIDGFVVFDLNAVTAAELLLIRGIGNYYSQAIIDYRDKLGGYISVDQLLEVPSFKVEQFDELRSRFVSNGSVERLIAPQLEFKELLRHPYVDFNTAKRLKNISVYDYEEDLEALVKEGVFDDRLLPYISKGE